MNSKVKLLPLLTGIFALSISIASALPAYSQSTTPTTPRTGHQMRRGNFLNLTAEQKTKMQQIRQNERSQIDAILTDEQRAQLQRERANWKRPTGENRMAASAGENRRVKRSPFESLNLTAEQRSQIAAVRRSSKEQMDALLTPEQRQQIQQHQKQHQQRRQGNS